MRISRARLFLGVALGLALSTLGCRASPSAPPAGNAAEVGTATDLSVTRVAVGYGPTNCWVVHLPQSREALVVDPGADVEKIQRALDAQGVRCAAIVHTHGHGDHTGASRQLQARSGAPLWRHPHQGDVASPRLATAPSSGPVRDLSEGQPLSVGGMMFRVLLTPGHAPGSVCLWGHGLLFSGDLLFRRNVGRSDLPGGNQVELIRSLKERLAIVPAETRVLPGHGETTTMGEERSANPWFGR